MAPGGLDDLHDLALAAASAAASAIRFVSPDRLETRDKGGVDDLVTTADVAAEKAIIEVILAHRPDDEIIAEESGAHQGTSGVCWYVDPLDGTANFVAGSPNYAVCVAAVCAGEPLAAVIYRPADGRWLGTGPAGALRGPITPGLAPPQPLGRSSINVSRPHDPIRAREANHLREALSSHVGAEHRTGAASHSQLLVATGEFAAYISVDIPLWDTAAGHALIRRAGGSVAYTRLPAGMPVAVAGAPWAVRQLVPIIEALEPLSRARLD